MKTRREHYQERKAKGLCTRCGEPAKNDLIYCQKCNQDNIKRNAKRRSKLKKDNLCVACGEPAKNDLIYCQTCHQNNLKRNIERTVKLKKNCLCINCEKPTIEDKVHCLKCSQANNQRMNKMRTERKFKDLCRRCGLPTNGRRVYCDKCSVYDTLSSQLRHSLSHNDQSKNGRSWTTLVNFTEEELHKHINKWKEVQGIKKRFDLHHIVYQSEIDWKEVGDNAWNKLWSLSNLMPLRKKDHQAVHSGDLSGIHPEVIKHINKIRGG